MTGRRLIPSILAGIAMLAVVVGFYTAGTAAAASQDCSGSVKWNGSLTNPMYYWIIDIGDPEDPEDDSIAFCPKSVVCDDGSTNCNLQAGWASPPATGMTYSCWCPGASAVTCTTKVTTNGPMSPPTSVTCVQMGCTLPEECELRPQGSPDGNGHYTVNCKCQ